MKKTTLMTISLAAAAALAMTGCGSSNGGGSNPTPTPTNTPAPTPAPTNTPAPTPTPAPETQPAPVNPVSVQQLLLNTPTIQGTNAAMAITESVSTVVSATITQFIVNGILAPVSGDLPCATLGVNQGSGSIHGVAASLAQGGNSYKIDFSECKFDTLTTLAPSKGGNDITDLNISECTALIDAFDVNLTESNATVMFGPDDFNATKDYAAACTKQLGSISATGDNAADLKAALTALHKVNAFSDKFKDKYGHELPDLGTTAPLNDLLTITGSIYAEVNLNPTKPAGNIWTAKFAATNYDMTLQDNSQKVTKFRATMNGDETGMFNVKPFVEGLVVSAVPAKPIEKGSLKIAGTNDLTATMMFNSASLNLFVDTAITGQGAAHSMERKATLDKVNPTSPATPKLSYTNTWKEILEASANDSGEGFYKATFVDHSTGYEGVFSLYNKGFAQTRLVETDPSAVVSVGVGRRSTYTMNGQYGLNTKGTPFIWNTMGAFTITTSTPAVKTKVRSDTGTNRPPRVANDDYDYQVNTGDITIAGTAPIDFKFLPDAAANTRSGDGGTDGSIVMSVGQDIKTFTPAMWSWLEVTPQP